jgi:hypothetical protein
MGQQPAQPLSPQAVYAQSQQQPGIYQPMMPQQAVPYSYPQQPLPYPQQAFYPPPLPQQQQQQQQQQQAVYQPPPQV